MLDKGKLPFPTGTDPQSVRQRVEAMEKLLERVFIIPGLNRPIGLDVILDVVPFAGNVAAAALGAYVVWEARNLGMSKMQMTRMAGNVGVDWVLGLIPWIGAIPDYFFQSNRCIVRHFTIRFGSQPFGARLEEFFCLTIHEIHVTALYSSGEKNAIRIFHKIYEMFTRTLNHGVKRLCLVPRPTNTMAINEVWSKNHTNIIKFESLRGIDTADLI